MASASKSLEPESRVRGATTSASKFLAPASRVRGVAASASESLAPASRVRGAARRSRWWRLWEKRRKLCATETQVRPSWSLRSRKRRCPAALNACSAMNWSMWCFVTPWKRPQRLQTSLMSRLPSDVGAETRRPLVRIPGKRRDGLADLEADAGVQRCRLQGGVGNREPGTLCRAQHAGTHRGVPILPRCQGCDQLRVDQHQKTQKPLRLTQQRNVETAASPYHCQGREHPHGSRQQTNGTSQQTGGPWKTKGNENS